MMLRKNFFLRLSLFFYVPLFIVPFISACKTVGSFYTRPRVASYYVNRYCFELPKKQVVEAVHWMLTKYNFPIKNKDLERGRFSTKPVYMPRFNHNPKWGYVIALEIRVEESKGRLSLKGIPDWFFQKKRRPTPKPPQRQKYASSEAYEKAVEDYQRRLQELIEGQMRGVALMKRWQGCDIRRSSLRSTVHIKAHITAHPLGRFGQIQRHKKGYPVRSRNRLEYSMLRVLGWKLRRLKNMPRLLH